MSLQQRVDGLPDAIFLGGRPDRFEEHGRLMFMALLRRGLLPSSEVIDVGCGALRAGYWLIHFLEPGRYHGIEPARHRLTTAREAILEPGLEEVKRPTFDDNTDWDLGVFGVAPDFVLARSIWSHTTAEEVQALLDAFVAVAADDGLLLVSYVPRRQEGSLRGRLRTGIWRIRAEVRRRRGSSRVAPSEGFRPGRRRMRQSKRQQTSTRSPHDRKPWGGTKRPIRAFDLEFIAHECRARRLTVLESDQDRFGGQTWLEIRRATAPAGRSSADGGGITAT